MPGYDINRFVNLSQTDRDELVCIICKDIMCSPLVAQCCQQAFCEECINRWLESNNTCPYDRKPLTINGLSLPMIAISNILAKLQITCEYKDNGCDQVIALDQLDKHVVDCKFSPKKCDKCQCIVSQVSKHDCISQLLNKQSEMQTKIR
ncbi:E3 ubiquitin-protein ligase NRDP1-like [Oppia nitens]|uniref:E3 ubiquitin-protein ligase NRDP1-like n=1 Tax=Oppia nitens TaxID=1686743 RepID=UPI0023DA1F68|nr:E3 ubiquitin-protein ligase NRDP1-like [Oppia nitens]